MKAKEVKVLIAAHKPYWVPDDPLYLPMQVGAFGKPRIPGFQGDDQGANISDRNPRYCELTAVYWAWKNLEADYIGLAHYRRHYKGTGTRNTLTCGEALELLHAAPVVVPKKRNYYIETVESHYAHTFDGAHLELLRNILREKSPDVLPAFERHMGSRSAHIWNMSIMERSLFEQWCAWLFPLLEEADKLIDYSGMTPFEARAIGRMSERLFDPWLTANDIEYVEAPVISTEKTNWPKKGASFLAAKFRGKKYTESF